MGVTELVLELQAHKANIKGVSIGYSVAMVTFYVEKMITTCRAIIGYLFDTIFKDTSVSIVSIHQRIRKIRKLFLATLS